MIDQTHLRMGRARALSDNYDRIVNLEGEMTVPPSTMHELRRTLAKGIMDANSGHSVFKLVYCEPVIVHWKDDGWWTYVVLPQL